MVPDKVFGQGPLKQHWSRLGQQGRLHECPCKAQKQQFPAREGSQIHNQGRRSPPRKQFNPNVKPSGRPLRFENSNNRSQPSHSKKMNRVRKSSDGTSHLGNALEIQPREFPGPPPSEGPPLRVLPIGGLGEIGMNCMLVGVNDRYILIDAGLMFPDASDLGMNKILPDTGFLHQWKDKIEAVIITHGHEDHIGAMPWVFPALDPSTKIYAGKFASQLIKRRLVEFNLWDKNRIHVFEMGDTFQLGPFSCEPVRVTHSIPDCCGLILRSDHGTIVHTGDWKIDENPIDGQKFNRELFEKIGREGVTLMMSDSTNILSPGRSSSEKDVEEALMRRVLGHKGKGRVLSTQFASNVHRLGSVKKAADAAGRKLCFLGLSLNTYLEAAQIQGQAPFNPNDLIQPQELGDYDPNEVMVVTTGSQGEPRAALSLASQDASPLLKLEPSDLLLYSAKVIPGNDTGVMQLMNRVSSLGVEIAMGRDENLHTSGHAYREELREVLELVKPQHFLPVHGESAFLYAHAQLGRETGIRHTSVIKNGEMLGVSPLRNGKSIGGVSGMQNLGKVPLRLLYNDGNRGTGTSVDMSLPERQKLAEEGLVVVAVDVDRTNSNNTKRPDGNGQNETDDSSGDISDEDFALQRMQGKVKVTTRAMWHANGNLQGALHKASVLALWRLPYDAELSAVERVVTKAILRESKAFNRKQPEVIVIANESDPIAAKKILRESRKNMETSKN